MPSISHQFPASLSRFRVLAGYGVIAGLLATLGCNPAQPTASSATSTSTTPAVSSDKPLQIAVIPKGTTHVFWKSVHYGALQAAKEMNAEIQWRGPQKESDRDEQINIVQGFLNKRVDGMVLAPLDADALVRPVQEAKRGGVPVVIFDSGLNSPKGDTVAFVATDNIRGGQMAADTMALKLGEKGNVVVLRYNKGSESTHQREEGFLEAIAKYPNIKVISSDQYAGTTTETAVDKAQQVLNKFGDEVNGIFAVCEPNAEGVLRALKDRKIAGKVVFVAFDSSDALKASLASGEVAAIVLQDPVQMGYLGVKTLIQSLRGESVESFVDTGVFVAVKENMDDDKIKSLLTPEKT